MQIDLPVERDEIRLIIGEEDGLSINDQLVKGLVGDAEKVAIAVAGRPITATVGSLYEGRRQALVNSELHTAAGGPTDRARFCPAGRPRRGLPFAQSTATS
jgi:hypothetical protein